MAGLVLHRVRPLAGLQWVRQGFALFFRRPLAFTSLFVLFIFGCLLLALVVPYLGGAIALGAAPLLSLGFMIATRSALHDGPVHPGQLVEALRGDAARRRTLLKLCLTYALCGAVIVLLWRAVDDGRFDRWQELMASGKATREDVDALFADGRLQWGLMVFVTLVSALSVPFWHAPALVHWGGQGAAQALFSSTLALWRSRAAFVFYLLGWTAVVVLFGVLAAVVFGLLGMQAMVPVAAFPAALMFSTAFYVSLYFVFADTFGAP
jgi:hypothetical protein